MTINTLEEFKDLDNLVKLMEEMAGLPKEEHGKRQPGEQGSYEKYTQGPL